MRRDEKRSPVLPCPAIGPFEIYSNRKRKHDSLLTERFESCKTELDRVAFYDACRDKHREGVRRGHTAD